MVKWKTAGPGIRYREHPTRKHGITPDRYYVIHYRIDGARVEEAMGWLSQGNTQEACENTRNKLKNSAKNSGPKTRKAERAITAAAEKKAPIVEHLFEEYWTKELQHTPSGKERRRLVVKDVLPVWGNCKVADITRRDAVLLIDDVRERAPVTANRLQGVLVRMFNFAAERGIIEHSPLAGMRKTKEQARQRVLTDEEIKLLWTALDLESMQMDIFRVSKLALKMILLTGQRPGEVAGMRWDEIDQGNFWNIPAERRKGENSQRVPLSGMALDVIEQARMYSGESPFVFASPHKPDSHLMTHTLSKAIIRHWQEIGFEKPFTPHDLRRTLRTRLAEIGISDVVAECVLGHKLQRIIAVYNQHSYDTEKRQALDKWNRKLKKICVFSASLP